MIEMSVVDQLLDKRAESARARPEFGRMGLKADAEELQLVSELRSESWPLLVPLSVLGAGYKETQLTTFQIQLSPPGKPISHLRIDMVIDHTHTYIHTYICIQYIKYDMYNI